MFIVFLHGDNGAMQYGGCFSTYEKAKTVCNKYNENHTEMFADLINVTDEIDEDFIN